MGAMDRGLRERVRWGNVARAVAVVGVVALVVVWPVLAPEAPRVPGAVPVPVVTRRRRRLLRRPWCGVVGSVRVVRRRTAGR